MRKRKTFPFMEIEGVRFTAQIIYNSDTGHIGTHIERFWKAKAAADAKEWYKNNPPTDEQKATKELKRKDRVAAMTDEERYEKLGRDRERYKNNPMTDEQKANNKTRSNIYRKNNPMTDEQKARRARQAKDRALNNPMTDEQNEVRRTKGRERYKNNPPTDEQKANNKTKCKEWYKNNPPTDARREQVYKNGKKWRENNPRTDNDREQYNTRKRERYASLTDEGMAEDRAKQKAWRDGRTDEQKARGNECERELRKNNPDKYRGYKRERRIYLSAYIDCKKLNPAFPGCDFHHLTPDTGVHIPTTLHRSVSHNLRTGKNMKRINDIVLEWLQGVRRESPQTTL